MLEYQVSTALFTLEAGDVLYVGNNEASTSPLKMLRRIEFFSSSYSTASSPSVSELYSGNRD